MLSDESGSRKTRKVAKGRPTPFVLFAPFRRFRGPTVPTQHSSFSTWSGLENLGEARSIGGAEEGQHLEPLALQRGIHHATLANQALELIHRLRRLRTTAAQLLLPCALLPTPAEKPPAFAEAAPP